MTWVHSYYYSEQKRALDIFLALFGFIVGAPIFIFLAVYLFFTIGQPILYKQKRVGMYGSVFWMYKFRTMYRDADREQKKFRKLNIAPGPMFKIPQDPRFVGIGQFLSHSGLDELPQFWNILKGEMSFVGPRPLPVTEWKSLPSTWRFRDTVKPGIFSYWTLASNRHKSLSQWQRLDKLTMKQGSWVGDLSIISRILLRSFYKMITKTKFF